MPRSFGVKVMMPRVSVVIPTYNRQSKLKRALMSVLNQTFKDFEVIIVDNASSDDTEITVKGVQDLRIVYIRHSANLGGPAARNTGIKMARASLIALLDDDDEWFPEKLTKQVDQFQKASAKTGLIYSSAEIYDELKHHRISVNATDFRGNVYERVLLGTILASVTVLIKRECFEKVGFFDETLSSCQDWDMWLRIAHDFEFDYVDEVLARVNMHGEQISNDYAKLIPGRTRMVQKHAEEFKKYPGIYVNHLKRIGKLHCLNGTWNQGLNWFGQALMIHPWEIGKILAWVMLEYPQAKLFSTQDFKKYHEGSSGRVS